MLLRIHFSILSQQWALQFQRNKHVLYASDYVHIHPIINEPHHGIITNASES